MNRRQKIIVSITGIFIVLLALVGLTYAYFLTQIKGNPNSNSITVSTANLVLEYKDGNGELRAANKLTPNTDILFNKVENGEIVVDGEGNPVVVNSKTFSVENKGNETVENYAVTVENYSLTYVTSGKDSEGNDVVAGAETTFKYPETLVVNVTCTSNKGECNGVENRVFPESNDILLYNDIEVGEKHEYTLTMKYIDNGENQSADMNKTLSAQINIIDANNTVDLTGEVASYALGDYVRINSEPKTSRIVKNKDGKYIYKIVGVKPDDHELGVYNDGNETPLKGSSELSIVKGKESSVVGNVITITDASREVNIDITSTYLTTIGSMKSRLKDTIITNTSIQKNGTLLVDRPVTSIGNIISTNWDQGIEENHYFYLHKFHGIEIISENEDDILNCLEATYGYYDSDLCPNVVKASGHETCNEVKNKYIYHGAYGVQFIEDCDNGKFVLGKAKYEKTLVKSNNEYYYRGKVDDNYLNYNGMCWKIVSLQSDGSIKIVLEDQYDKCNETVDTDFDGKVYTGNWNIGQGYYGYIQRGDYEFDLDYLNNNVLIYDSYDSTKTIEPMKIILDNWFKNNNFNIDILKKETWKIISSNSNTIDSYIYSLGNYDSIKAGSYEYSGYFGEIQSINYLTNEYAINKSFFTSVVPDEYSLSNNILDSLGVLIQVAPYQIDDVVQIQATVSSIRPVIVLKSGIIASGEGTITNPYVVD